jgi:predicted transcriptional regulator
MKLLKAKEWTDEEVRVLTTMVREQSTASEIASALGRHIASVKRMASEFCLPLARKQTSVMASRSKTPSLRRSRYG